MPNRWKRLKSGSDIRGIAFGEDEKIELNNEVVQKIGLAFAKWIFKNKHIGYEAMTIAIGNDPRLSSMRIKTSLMSALTSIGIKIYDCSLTSTPAMAMAVSSLTCAASIQITASHHPANRNGFKFFTKTGPLSSADIEEILTMAQAGEFPPIALKTGEVKPINMMNYYCNKIKNVIKNTVNNKTDIIDGFEDNESDISSNLLPLEGLKVTVDASNGSGGFFVKNILNELGADTSSSIFLEPNGNFPNHSPNPEDPVAITALSKAVVNAKTDLGIIFDTDVDRVAFVDSNGKIISKSKLIAFISFLILEEIPGASIVTDSVTSNKLTEYIKNLDGTHIRYKRGYKNVIEYAQKINRAGINCPLAIETSGHAALRENNFIDDGAYLAAKIIAKLVMLKEKNISINKITEGFVNAKEQIEIRITINDPRVISSSRKVLTCFKEHIKTIKGCEPQNSPEGVRATFKARWQEGWCILRKSVHDPSLVLNIESYVNNGALSILNSLIPFFGKFQFIEVDEIKKQAENLKNANLISVEV